MSASRDDAGFSVIELTVVLAVVSLVIVSFLSVLDVMTRNQQRQESLVADQEAVRLALQQLSQDLRAANPIEPLSTSSAYANVMELAVPAPGGVATSYLRWELNGTTLTRAELAAPGSTPTATRTVLTNLSNGSTPLFRYYNSAGLELTAAGNTPGDFTNCTIRVHITITAAVNPGPLPFTADDDAEIRNRLPGGIGC